jgi:hypothetical protein
MHGNHGYSSLLVVGSQIANLTPNFSFGHNLCFKNPNGSCEPILNIYIPRSFHYYNEILNKIRFYPYNFPLKIQESMRIPTPKMRVHLGVWGFIFSHSLALPGSFLACTFALVANPKLRLWHLLSRPIIHVLTNLWLL